MLRGLMQDRPLMISGILSHAAEAHEGREIVSRLIDEPIWRYGYAEWAARVARAANMLQSLDIAAGDRVSTLAWNTHRHFELMYAAPGIQAVLHTANPRLHDDQIAFTITHAGSSVLFFDRNLLPLVERLQPRLPAVRRYIMLSDVVRLDPGAVAAESYEALIDAQPAGHRWRAFDENSGAILCYTSGTTGDPKGVLYSHRSIVLHAMAAGLSGAMNLSAFEAVMPASSLYHANGWGLPFAAAINGCKMVLPADRLDGASLYELIEAEAVTLSAGVPTIWGAYLQHLQTIGIAEHSLKRVLIGGSPLPVSLRNDLRAHGIAAVQSLGMTETSPMIVAATPTPALLAQGEEQAEHILATRQGRSIYGIQRRVVDDEGKEVPRDGKSAGALQVRGPWVVDRYYPDIPATDEAGWFDTGDIATLDELGYLRITDREKDVIKSGGEWISSIDLENAVSGCPGVRVAAVIGVAHPHWQERPLMVVEPHAGAELLPEQIRAYLEARVVRWWLPDAIVVADVPVTATGKADKKALRDIYRDHLANL